MGAIPSRLPLLSAIATRHNGQAQWQVHSGTDTLTDTLWDRHSCKHTVRQTHLRAHTHKPTSCDVEAHTRARTHLDSVTAQQKHTHTHIHTHSITQIEDPGIAAFLLQSRQTRSSATAGEPTAVALARILGCEPASVGPVGSGGGGGGTVPAGPAAGLSSGGGGGGVAARVVGEAMASFALMDLLRGRLKEAGIWDYFQQVRVHPPVSLLPLVRFPPLP